MSDERHFHLSGFVNKQNFHYWCDVNPMVLHERPFHSNKVTVWCAVSGKVIIGSYSFKDGRERAVTVNGEQYWEMLQTFFVEELQIRNEQE
jgi:hypothetical protein